MASSLHQYPGNLTYPDDISAEYVVQVASLLQATAVWSGGAPLTLDVACPGATRSVSGGSVLHVQAAFAGDGRCTVVLSEPTGTAATVSYVLDLTYQAP